MTRYATIVAAIVLTLLFGATYVSIAQQPRSSGTGSKNDTNRTLSKCQIAQTKLDSTQATIDELDRKMDALLIRVEEAKTGQIEAVIALLKESVYQRKLIRTELQEMNAVRQAHLMGHLSAGKPLSCPLMPPRK